MPSPTLWHHFNDDVVGIATTGDATSTSEWSTILLPTKVQLTLEVWQYVTYVPRKTFQLNIHIHDKVFLWYQKTKVYFMLLWPHLNSVFCCHSSDWESSLLMKKKLGSLKLFINDLSTMGTVCWTWAQSAEHTGESFYANFLKTSWVLCLQAHFQRDCGQNLANSQSYLF